MSNSNASSDLPKTTRVYQWNVGGEGRRWERWECVTVQCIEQRGLYYADVNTLNAGSIGVGPTEDAAFKDWARKCNAKAVVQSPAVVARDKAEQRQIHETGDDSTAWYAKVLYQDGRYEVLVYDADGDRRPEREQVFTDQAQAVGHADRAVLRSFEQVAAKAPAVNTPDASLDEEPAGRCGMVDRPSP